MRILAKAQQKSKQRQAQKLKKRHRAKPVSLHHTHSTL